ncbi:MAG: hypothetical protein Q9190_004572, partial [Brigantiaea leucoxantha]
MNVSVDMLPVEVKEAGVILVMDVLMLPIEPDEPVSMFIVNAKVFWRHAFGEGLDLLKGLLAVQEESEVVATPEERRICHRSEMAIEEIPREGRPRQIIFQCSHTACLALLFYLDEDMIDSHLRRFEQVFILGKDPAC